MFEDDEWNGIQNDTEADENDEDIEDYSSEGWETEGDEGAEEEEEEEEEEESDEGFEDDDLDVSENEILYDKDGNIITEEDVGEGLKKIMERYMNKLWKRLDMYAALASMEDKNDGEEEPKEIEKSHFK